MNNLRNAYQVMINYRQKIINFINEHNTSNIHLHCKHNQSSNSLKHLLRKLKLTYTIKLKLCDD